MYKFHRRANFKPGALRESTEWAKQVADYVTRASSVSVDVFTEVFGELGTIHWFSEHDDMASLEELNNNLNADPEYWETVNRGTGFIIPGTVRDTLMQEL